MLQKKKVEDHKEFIKQLGLGFSCHPVTYEDQAFLSILCTVLSEHDVEAIDKDILVLLKRSFRKTWNSK